MNIGYLCRVTPRLCDPHSCHAGSAGCIGQMELCQDDAALRKRVRRRPGTLLQQDRDVDGRGRASPGLIQSIPTSKKDQTFDVSSFMPRTTFARRQSRCWGHLRMSCTVTLFGAAVGTLFATMPRTAPAMNAASMPHPRFRPLCDGARVSRRSGLGIDVRPSGLPCSSKVDLSRHDPVG